MKKKAHPMRDNPEEVISLNRQDNLIGVSLYMYYYLHVTS